MRAHPCRGLRAAAWQRLCTIHIDEGAFAEAQLAFSQTQREAPDNPGTALLEIALLATQHEDNLAGIAPSSGATSCAVRARRTPGFLISWSRPAAIPRMPS
jgi:hypothetical protein